MTHETFREQLPLYVIGALDGEELREFERYVDAHREQCEVEIVEFQEVANKLALAAPPATPSPKVFDRVLEAIEESDPARETRVREERSTIDLRDLIFRWLPWAMTAVLCVALVFAFIELSKTRQRFDEQRDALARQFDVQITKVLSQWKASVGQMQELVSQIKQQKGEIANLQATNARLASDKAQLVQTTEELRQQLDSQNVKFASLEQKVSEQEAFLELMKDPAISVANLADPKGGKSSAKVYWHRVTKKGMVVVSNLQAVLKGKGTSLELWTFCGDKPPVATKLFWTDETGHGAYPISIPGDVACVDKFAVTVEPTNDELFSAPKGSVVLVGP